MGDTHDSGSEGDWSGLFVICKHESVTHLASSSDDALVTGNQTKSSSLVRRYPLLFHTRPIDNRDNHS